MPEIHQISQPSQLLSSPYLKIKTVKSSSNRREAVVWGLSSLLFSSLLETESRVGLI
jgi:hypothetical protein